MCQLNIFVTGVSSLAVKQPWNADRDVITLSTESLSENENVWLFWGLYDGDDAIGGFYMSYYSSSSKTTEVQYNINKCHYDKDVSIALPAAEQKTWTIKYEREAKKFVLTCNGVKVVNVALSDVCTQNGWSKLWETIPTQIKIDSSKHLSQQVNVIGSLIVESELPPLTFLENVKIDRSIFKNLFLLFKNVQTN